MGVCDFDLELRGVKLPDRESYLGDLSAEQIVEKINRFHERLKREAHLQVAPFAESYFLNLLALYPVSMCSKEMSDPLKLVAALFYFGSQPAKAEPANGEQEIKELFPRNRPSPVHRGYTFEDLALMFDRTRGAIAEAIKQKQEVAEVMLEAATLRCQRQAELAKEPEPALENLTEALTDEEKHALTQQEAEREQKKRTGLPC